MKKTALLILGFLVQFHFTFAQSVEVNLPSFDENGLANFLTSSTLQAVIFVLAGIAATMGIFYLIGNLRMAYDANTPSGSTSARHITPTDIRSRIGLPGGALSEYIPQLVPVDHETEEEEDERGETKGQRGD